MKHGDKKADGAGPPQRQEGPDRSPAWRQLTDAYLRDLPRQLCEVISLLEARDYVGIQQLAHRVKGTTGTYGLAGIAEKSAQLEQAAATGDSKQIAGLVDVIRQLIEAETAKLVSQSAPVDELGDGGGHG